MKFVIYTQFYPPEMGAPQARLSDLAKRLKSFGHEVQVLTAMPNYPHGQIFANYQGINYKKEEQAGIVIHRAKIIPSNRPQIMPRLLSYLSFCFSSFLTGFFRIGTPDIIITESPPLFLAVSGWLLAKIKGARLILNISDLWPDSAHHIGMLKESSLPSRVLRGLAHFCYRRAWLVTGQSAEIIAEISKQVPEAKTYHLSNGVDPENFSPQRQSENIRKHYLRNGELGFVYAGLHGLFQGLDQILELAERLQDQEVRFLFFGDGPLKQELMKISRERRLDKVDFYPALPHQEMPPILASMDAAIIALTSKIVGAVPSKIYEAMAAGIPILLLAEGEASEIVKKTNSGLAVSPRDGHRLVQAANQLAADAGLRAALGQAGRRAALTSFSRAHIAQAFESELKSRLPWGSGLTPDRIKSKNSHHLVIQRVEDRLAYASRGYKILKSANNGISWEEDGTVMVPWWKRLAAISPVIGRLTRERVYGVLPLPSGARLSLVSGMITRAEPQSSLYRCVFRLPRGSHPLNLCRCPDGKIYWGEYFLNLRRSDPVNIYCSPDDGLHWHLAYTFPQGSICHIHKVTYDPYDGSILVCTGDRDNEVGIYKTEDEFRTLRMLVSGNQEYRTASLIPCRDFLLYGTDNPNGQNYIMALDKSTHKIERLQKIPGPVLYGCRAGDKVVFATMIENRNHEITLWAGKDNTFSQVACFGAKKSFWLWRELLGYSTVILPEGTGRPNTIMGTPLGTFEHSYSLIEVVV